MLGDRIFAQTEPAFAERGPARLLATVILGVIAAAGCVGDPGPIPDGLHITASTPDALRGTFAKDGVEVGFEFAIEDGMGHVRVTDMAGRSLIDAVGADGVDPTTLLDRGRLGAGGGDAPEADLLSPLRDALHAMRPAELEGSAELPPRTDRVSPRATALSCGQYLPCGSWAAPGQVVYCGTVFLGATGIYVQNLSSGTNDYVHYWSSTSPGPIYYCGEQGSPQWVGPYSSLSLSGWWWGQWVYVYNDGPNYIRVTH